MKDEIKEILDMLKQHISIISVEDEDLLLDYITNLQVIEKEYNFLLSENAELENKITNLQEENERLKIKCDFLVGKKMVELDRNAKQVEIKAIEQQDYKTRNEKAIEYIKSHKEERAYYDPFGTPPGIPNHYEYFVKGYYELLEILQGKSDE